jgi:hypothetical protein
VPRRAAKRRDRNDLPERGTSMRRPASVKVLARGAGSFARLRGGPRPSSKATCPFLHGCRDTSFQPLGALWHLLLHMGSREPPSPCFHSHSSCRAALGSVHAGLRPIGRCNLASRARGPAPGAQSPGLGRPVVSLILLNTLPGGYLRYGPTSAERTWGILRGRFLDRSSKMHPGHATPGSSSPCAPCGSRSATARTPRP